MPDRMEMLREASERVCKTLDHVEGYAKAMELADDDYAEVCPHKMSFYRDVRTLADLLSGTWPDQEAVERARIEMLNEGDQTIMDQFEPGELEILIRVGINAALFGGEALTAALGLTVLERG